MIQLHDPRIPQKWWDKIKPDSSGCWLWTGKIDKAGYGRIYLNPRDRAALAHRVFYCYLVGQPTEETLDHLCRVPLCVNPSHLEPVSNTENILRGFGPSAINARKTHCIRGHALSESNLYQRTNHWRRCRECDRQRRSERTVRELAARQTTDKAALAGEK